jgi:hypothetical protein
VCVNISVAYKTPTFAFQKTLYVSTQAYTSRLILHTWSRANGIIVRGSVNLPKNTLKFRFSEGLRQCLIHHSNIMFNTEHCSLSDIHSSQSDNIQSSSTPVSVSAFNFFCQVCYFFSGFVRNPAKRLKIYSVGPSARTSGTFRESLGEFFDIWEFYGKLSWRFHFYLDIICLRTTFTWWPTCSSVRISLTERKIKVCIVFYFSPVWVRTGRFSEK